jgi:hypothetical protein
MMEAADPIAALALAPSPPCAGDEWLFFVEVVGTDCRVVVGKAATLIVCAMRRA